MKKATLLLLIIITGLTSSAQLSVKKYKKEINKDRQPAWAHMDTDTKSLIKILEDLHRNSERVKFAYQLQGIHSG